jgi:hypothetical protein
MLTVMPEVSDISQDASPRSLRHMVPDQQILVLAETSAPKCRSPEGQYEAWLRRNKTYIAHQLHQRVWVSLY